MAASMEAAARPFEQLGASVREVSTTPLHEFLACNRIILTSEAYAMHETWMRERPQDYGALARERLMAGAFVRASDYVNALRMRRKITAAFHTLFNDVDVVITTSSMDPACRIDDPQAVEYTYKRQSRAPFNVTGSPALAIPAGFSGMGLPMGMQLVGKPWSEALLYRAAHAYEQVTPWHNRHPALP